MEKQSTLEERFGKCPYATAQGLISGKWAVLVLLFLEDGPIRFSAAPIKPRKSGCGLFGRLLNSGWN